MHNCLLISSHKNPGETGDKCPFLEPGTPQIYLLQGQNEKQRNPDTVQDMLSDS